MLHLFAPITLKLHIHTPATPLMAVSTIGLANEKFLVVVNIDVHIRTIYLGRIWFHRKFVTQDLSAVAPESFEHVREAVRGIAQWRRHEL